MSDEVARKVSDFFARYPETRCAKRQIIIHAGEEPTGVFYLVSGRVNQYDIAPNGVEVVVNVFKPQAFFPMSWAINKMPNEYFFEAATEAVVRRAPAGEVVAFLQGEPDVLFDLLARVYRGSDGLLRRMALLMGSDARSRLIFELLNAAYRFGVMGKAEAVQLPLKESDLAKHTGLARETVNRLVQGLKTAGLIEVTQEGLVIHDIVGLEAALERVP